MEFDLNCLPDLDSLDPEALQTLLAQLEELYHKTDLREPEEEDSEAYDEWLEELEEIQDLMDDIEDRLDGLTEGI